MPRDTSSVPFKRAARGTNSKIDRATPMVAKDRVICGVRVSDQTCQLLVIHDLEGELFFGAAPELDRHLDALKARAQGGAQVLIVRLRRVRNPDLVCMERLEHFPRDLHHEGVVVLLSGVGADLAQAMKNLRFEAWLPKTRVFHVISDSPGSSTIQAVRAAYALLGEAERAHCDHCRRMQRSDGDLYYMV